MIIPRTILLSIVTAVLALSVCPRASAQEKTFTVVIDPGHGGRDAGAVSGKVYEKELNLALALALGRQITRQMPDVKVVYTREDDSYVTLAERGRIANRAKADLFFSIHLNANKSASANGSETYVMGVHVNDESLAAAMRENEVMRYENDQTESMKNFDPSSPESYLVFSLMQYAHFDRSLLLARIIQKQYSRNTPMRNRGAKQAGFAVLFTPAMPSVLTEVGFVSNEADRKFITSQAGRDKVVRSLYDAFSEYKELFDMERPAARQSAANAEPGSEVAADAASAPGIYVQLLATRSRLSKDDRMLGEYRGKVVEKVADGWYKYYLGPFPSRQRADAARDKARKQKNFKDAFIVTL